MDVAIPLLTWILLGAGAIYACSNRVRPGERAWVLQMLVIAFALRMAAATMFAIWPETRIFHEDAIGYELNGLYIARSWLGQVPPVPTASLQNFGWVYVVGAIDYVFGLFQVAASYFNALCGTVTVFLVYRLARQFFHPVVARAAMRLCALVPSMVLWSAIALKDPLVTLLIVTSLSGCVALKRRFSVGALIATVLPIVLVQPIRFYMVYFLLLAVVMALVLDRGAKVLSGVPKQIVVIGGMALLLVATGLAGRAEQGAEMMSLSRASTFRHGMAVTAHSGFADDADVSTPLRALAFLPIGMSVLLFGPFPWQFTSMRALLAAPETIVWWAMIPSLVRGLRFALRTQFGRISPVALFTGTLTIAYSLVHGNVGSGFRQRAQIFVFLFIFAALGWYKNRCRHLGIDERHLLVEPSP